MRSSPTNSYKIRMFLTKKSIFQPYLLACFRWNRQLFNLCFVSAFVSGKNPAKEILGKAEMNRKRGQLVNTADKLARLHSWRVSQKILFEKCKFRRVLLDFTAFPSRYKQIYSILVWFCRQRTYLPRNGWCNQIVWLKFLYARGMLCSGGDSSRLRYVWGKLHSATDSDMFLYSIIRSASIVLDMKLGWSSDRLCGTIRVHVNYFYFLWKLQRIGIGGFYKSLCSMFTWCVLAIIRSDCGWSVYLVLVFW